ncbi:MAG: PaaI family thioesterase [Hyphomonadaceae bacterium]
MTAATQQLLDSIAYIAWHGQRVSEEGEAWATIVQPARDDLLNYVGLTHAGATYTLAETACGVVADALARTLGGFILLRAAEGRYLRPANGVLSARAQADDSARRAAAAAFSENGRADLPIAVVVESSDGQAVFEGHFQYALRARRA